MKINRAARQTAKRLFAACCQHGTLQPEKAKQVVRTLLNQKPRGYLPVLFRFKQLLALELHRHSALIESAEPLAESEKQALANQLTQTHGPLYDIAVRVDPSLIGGLRIRVGSNVLDGTVKGRLNQLAAAVRSN